MDGGHDGQAPIRTTGERMLFEPLLHTNDCSKRRIVRQAGSPLPEFEQPTRIINKVGCSLFRQRVCLHLPKLTLLLPPKKTYINCKSSYLLIFFDNVCPSDYSTFIDRPRLSPPMPFGGDGQISAFQPYRKTVQL